MYNSRVGLHLRLHTTVSAVARTARALKLPFFQFFLHAEKGARPFFLSAEDEKIFLRMRASFSALYVHSSYRFNIAASSYQHNEHMYTLFEQEIRLAVRLQATHYVLHPGTIEVGMDRFEMLSRVVSVLNAILVKYPDLVFCVENTANPSRLLGAALEDLVYINERIDVTERFGFCIDTAHFHAAGYPLYSINDQLNFFKKIKDNGIPILLVHLNDTSEPCGSFVDRHSELGKGLLGLNVLYNFAKHELVHNVPLIIESPELPFDMMQHLLQQVQEW